MDITRDNISNALSALGDDFRGVAQTLDDMGYKGDRGRTSSCPVSNYLKGLFPQAERVGVGSYTAVVREDLRDRHGMSAVPVPKAISEFVESFDSGAYPWLEATSPLEEVLEDAAVSCASLR